MSRVLVVDDEKQILRALSTNLRARNYEVDTALSGEEALIIAAKNKPDVVILDLGLPGIDGIEVIEALRGYSDVPILVLSVRENEADKVLALDAGADDYITKPFGMDELIARLRAALRRNVKGEETPVINTADFTIDLVSKKITKDDIQVKLTPTQWQIVEVLVRSKGKLVSQHQLLQEVWGSNYEDETNYLRVFMAQIRSKLEADPSKPKYFITEAGMGYRFVNS
jgi:two-component system KDP operon response regulator KdpE